MSKLIEFVDAQTRPEKAIPAVKAGDTVTVHYKIIEGAKERIQLFQGVIIQRRGGNSVGATFTIRKISNGIGVERIIPFNSPNIEKIELNRTGIVRRAKIFYIRKLTGKAARIKEKKM